MNTDSIYVYHTAYDYELTACVYVYVYIYIYLVSIFIHIYPLMGIQLPKNPPGSSLSPWSSVKSWCCQPPPKLASGGCRYDSTAVDGRNPKQPPGMYKTLEIMG